MKSIHAASLQSLGSRQSPEPRDPSVVSPRVAAHCPHRPPRAPASPRQSLPRGAAPRRSLSGPQTCPVPRSCWAGRQRPLPGTTFGSECRDIAQAVSGGNLQRGGRALITPALKSGPLFWSLRSLRAEAPVLPPSRSLKPGCTRASENPTIPGSQPHSQGRVPSGPREALEEGEVQGTPGEGRGPGKWTPLCPALLLPN